MQPLETKEQQDADMSLLFERFATPLLAYVCQQVADRQDAEDLLLEIFLAAIQNPSLLHFSSGGQLAWLRRVARNKVIDHYRHRALFTTHPLTLAEDLLDRDVTPEQHVEDLETRAWLVQALDHLSPTQRELIRLRYVQELRLTQIAALLEKSEGTVRKMLSRTLRQLQTRYEQDARRKHHG
jgi:RNA polymerase sigma-70 factor (ECF subfamily)